MKPWGFRILNIVSLFSDTSMKFYLSQAAFVMRRFRVQVCSGVSVLVAELIFLLFIIKSSYCCGVSISGKLTEHSEVITISLISQEFTSSSSSTSSTVLSTCMHVQEHTAIAVDGPLVLCVTKNTILY